MKLVKFILLLITPVILYGQEGNDISSFQDTIYFDQNSGNYIIKYLGDSSVGELDTIITMTFVPPTKVDPIINARVNFVYDSSYYLYSYRITNQEDAQQRLYKFRLYFNSNIQIQNRQLNNWHGGRYVIYGSERYLSWWGDGGLEPTWSADGFAISSEHLPGIGHAGFKGYTPILSYEHGRPNRAIENKLLKLSVKKESFVYKATVIPVVFNYLTSMDFLDTLKSYTDSSYSLSWIKDEQTRDKYNNYFNTAKTYLEQGDSSTARTELQKVLTDCNTDSATVLTSEAYALLYFNTEYLVNKLPEGEPGLPVKLEDSQGNLLQGGSLQYYDAGWKDAIDNGDGTFTVQTEKSTVSLKMTYAGGSQQKDNVTVGADTAVFQTSDVTVKLLSSSNTLLDSGFVQYYAGGWQDFGTLVNGVAHKELLSKNYNFKMKYAGSEKNHVQNLDTNTTVTFHTVNAEVQLRDSQNNLLSGGTVEYYASGWKDFGEATNGTANKELLSRSYTFKMHYANAENNLVQDLDSSTTVVFHTVNTTVQLKDSQENILNGDSVKYYASGWQYFGIPVNGSVSKELLPKQYNFKMYYGGADKNIVQNLDTNTTVTFHTVNAEVQLRDSQGNLLPGGFAKYYASGWKDFGEAVNGIAHKELFSRAYTFKIQYGGADMNHVQNLDTNTTVVFNTINVKAELRDSQGNLLDGGTVEYYASGWKDFGEATNGTASKELLPREYTFKMNYGGLNTTKDQDVSANNTVTFNTTLTTVKVKDDQDQPVENAEVFYYGGSWRQIGFTVNGEVTKELLARSINFKAKKDNKEKNKLQDTSTNSVVEIILE